MTVGITALQGGEDVKSEDCDYHRGGQHGWQLALNETSRALHAFARDPDLLASVIRPGQQQDEDPPGARCGAASATRGGADR